MRVPRIRAPWLAAAALLLAAGAAPAVDVVRPTVLAQTPHDTAAYTQGLLLHDGWFYESTGLYGESTLRQVAPATGAVLQSVNLPSAEFAEGLALVGTELRQLTWRAGTLYVRRLSDFGLLRTHAYSGEGWGLCYDGSRLVMSDGSDTLYFRNPTTFSITGSVRVTKDGNPVINLNELECVGELVYANVYMTDSIARIDPSTGIVLTEIDASDLLTRAEARDADVLNGIAFDPATDRFFLTGKLWPWVFEVEFDFNPYSASDCLVGDLQEVRDLQTRRVGANGMLFDWTEDPAAQEYHVNSVPAPADLVDPGPHLPDLPGGRGTPVCTAPAGSANCADPFALLSSQPLLFYQVYAACGPGGIHEGP